MLRKNSIFIKMLILMLSGITIISFVLIVASSNIAERILLNQVVRNASANMNIAKDELLRYNDQVVNAMLQINSSHEFKDYITKPANTTLEQINLAITLGRYIDVYKEYLSPEKSLRPSRRRRKTLFQQRAQMGQDSTGYRLYVHDH